MADPVSAAVLGATIRQFIAGTVSELKYRREFEGRQIKIIRDRQLIDRNGGKTNEIESIIEGTIGDVLEIPIAFELTDAEEYTVRRTHTRFHSGEIDTLERKITSPRKCEKCIPLDVIEDFELYSEDE